MVPQVVAAALRHFGGEVQLASIDEVLDRAGVTEFAANGLEEWVVSTLRQPCYVIGLRAGN